MSALATTEPIGATVETLGGLLTSVSMQLPEKVRINDWRRLGEALDRLSDTMLWWIADWAAYGERQYRRDYGEVLDRLAKETVYNLASISRKVEISCRHENLSIWHHAHVTKMSEPEQMLWLDEAERRGWTHQELRAEIAQHGGPVVETSKSPALTFRVDASDRERYLRGAEIEGMEPLEWLRAAAEDRLEKALGLASVAA